MEIKSISIKISQGKAEIDKKLELGQELILALKGDVVQEIYGDNQDGSKSVCYIIRAKEVKIANR